MSTRPFSIHLKRIIAVDSASFAYVEVPLNNNLVLLGTGNLGKSSVVNAVRFFFFPDINVNDADKKFAFISGANNSSDTAYYSKDQIYEHYFPTQDSRLILEVEHQLVDGTRRQHCQIISMAGNYRINRMFCPEPYESIQHLFWNKQGVAGTRPDSTTGTQLLTHLKKCHPDTKQLNQVEQLTEALYRVDILRPDLCPFVIFPINDVQVQSVSSIRALIKMLFNQDGSSLRLMTSTAIEANQAQDEKLEMDIAEIINEQKQLKNRKATLDKLKAAEPEFNALKLEYEKIKNEKSAAHAFGQLWFAKQEEKQALNDESANIGEKKNSLNNSLESVSQSKHTIESDIYSHETRLKEIDKVLQKNQKHLNKCEELCHPYANYSTQEVLGALKEDLSVKSDDLKLYTDQNKLETKIRELTEEIRNEEDELEKLQNKASNASFSLKSQLDDRSWETLNSVNTKLANANPGRELSDQEKTSIFQFTQLFEQKGNHFRFFDESIDKLSLLAEYSLEKEIENAEAELKAKQTDKNVLEKRSNGQTVHDAQSIKKKEKEVALLEKDIETLEKQSYVKQQTTELTEELKTKNQELSEFKEKRKKIKEDHEKLSSVHKDLNTQLNNKQTAIQGIEALLNRHSFVSQRFESVKDALASHQSGISETSLLETKEQNFDSIVKRLEEAESAKNDVHLRLTRMMTDGLIEDTFGLLKGERTEKAITDTFKSVSEQFELLEKNQEMLINDTVTHNALVRSRLERLSKTKDKIKLTVSQINSELAHAKVNDLEAVRLEITLNAHFDDLIQSWIEFDDLTGDGTLPEQWYVRLQTFLNSDAVNQQDGKLRMDNIVQAARYQTKKKDAPWDDKEQSNSTKMLINMHLCDVFIQKLSSDTSNIAFPLIMDEVGSVSKEQFPELMNGLNTKGHWLIGVTTHGKSGELIAQFSHHLVMDEVKTSQPYSKHRRNVCYPIDKTERLIIKDQGTLLELE